MPNATTERKDPMPLGILGAAFPSRFTKEQALCYLGLIVENGKKAILEAFIKSGILLCERAYIDFLNRLLASVTEYELLNDAEFAVSLELAYFHSVKNGPDWLSGLADHLKQIFPEELAQKILLHVLKGRTKEIGRIHKGGEKTKAELIDGFEARLKTHYDHYQRVLDAELSAAQFSLYHSKTPIRKGTSTYLIPCPNCSLEKRCDANTQRFRCKKCGFDKPFSEVQTVS